MDKSFKTKKITFLLLGLVIFSGLSLALNLSAQTSSKSEWLKLDELLKQDGLDKEVEAKAEQTKEEQEKLKAQELARYKIPSKDHFLGLLTELWLVKNAVTLKWDFSRPDFGLQQSFAEFLKDLGLRHVSFSILIINGPNVLHFGLPLPNKRYLFILSLPFIRQLNLSKKEIHLLMLEDYLRVQSGEWESKLKFNQMAMDFGKIPQFKTEKTEENKEENKEDKKENSAPYTWSPQTIKELIEQMNKVILYEGYNFEENFRVTKNVDKVLKNNLDLWNSYYLLFQKIAKLSQENSLYKHYNKIYPSAELKLEWLKPKNKTI